MSEPGYEVVSSGEWLTDDRVNRVCAHCVYYRGYLVNFHCLLPHNEKSFGVEVSQYQMTCAKFEAKTDE